MLIVDKVNIFTEKSACGFYQFADEIMLIVDEVYNLKKMMSIESNHLILLVGSGALAVIY